MIARLKFVPIALLAESMANGGADSFRVSLFALIRTIFLRDYRLRRAES